MSNEREKKQILLMLEEGKINAEQAEKLLRALDVTEPKTEIKTESKFSPVSEKANGGKLKGKFKVEVQSADGDNVVVTLPLMLAKLAVNMMPASKMAEIKANGVDINEIVNNIESFVDMVDEDIVNVQSADGDKVRIYIEK
jgi:hypothetical protein